MQLNGKVFLVTGAGSGLGAATARMAVSSGAQVVVADLNRAGGQSVVNELGDKARFVECDVANEASAKSAVQAALDAFGRIDVLVNCAGIAPGMKTLGKEGPHTLELFQKVVTVNLIGSFNMIRLVADAMNRNAPGADGERGVIVSTASVAAFDGQMGQAAYAASKGGVVGMTLPIARDLARNGIRVMTVAPGIMETPMLLGMAPEVQESLGKMVPFPSRLGKPDEYASLVRHIVENAYLNGEVIRMDGAIRLQPK